MKNYLGGLEVEEKNNIILAVRTTQTQVDKLKDFANIRGVTPSEVVNEAVKYFIEMEECFNE